MIAIGPVLQNDIADLVELEMGLFREDAGTHERFADATWPEREGHDAANEGAQRFYARLGFEAVSVSKALLL